MVWKMSCNCTDINESTINSQSDFQKAKDFFYRECQKNTFQEIDPQQPYFTWKQGDYTKKWYATKWYKCMICGCLWEFQYPDFPATGFIRKFPDGVYHERGF